MSMRKEYLKIIDETIAVDSDALYPKAVKVVEFAVGNKGGKLYTMPSDVDVALVMTEDIASSQGVFEVYCRGLLWGRQNPIDRASLFTEFKQADYFTIKLASSNNKDLIRMHGELLPISYGNFYPMETSDDSSQWYISHIGYSCLGYDERFSGCVPMPEAGIDAEFVDNGNLPNTFAKIGKDFSDLSKIYRKLLRHHNYLGNLYYLLTEDVNKHIYMLGFDIRGYSLDNYLSLLDNCMMGLCGILFEPNDKYPKNINLTNLSSSVTSAKLSSLNRREGNCLNIDPNLDNQLKSIILDAKQSECYKHLIKHRNQRITHFGKKFVSKESRNIESGVHIIQDNITLVGGTSWISIKDKIYKDLLHCANAFYYIEICLETIARGCGIFHIQPIRHYKDIQSYPRHSALWDLYDMLPKEKFDIPWVDKDVAIPC